MFYSDIFSIIDKIVKHHRSFGGHLVHPSGARVFDSIMRGFSDRAVVGLTYEAELDAGSKLIPTYIHIGKVDGGYTYDESTVNQWLD